MKILVINDIVNFHAQNKTHFSLTKGFYFAKELSNINNNQLYFLTTGELIKNANDYMTMFLDEQNEQKLEKIIISTYFTKIIFEENL